MTDRIQLNLRLDKYPEMYKLIQTRAKKEGLSINDFCINLLREGLDLDVDKTPLGQALKRIDSIEQRLAALEEQQQPGKPHKPAA